MSLKTHERDRCNHQDHTASSTVLAIGYDPFRKSRTLEPDGTTTVEGTINDTELGRRSLKRWDERKCWWIDLPAPLCDSVKLTIRLASEELPEELKELLKKNPLARTRRAQLT